MNDNVKEFIKAINEDEALNKEFLELSKSIEGVTDREKVIEEQVLPFAKRCGFDLSVDDFALPEGEIDEAELKAVNGGICICVLAGGGDGTDARDGKSYTCVCVAYGQGGDGEANDANCFCPLSGAGEDEAEFF